MALRSVTQKLHPYFQAYQVTVLRSILHKIELFGRMLKWAIELSDYEITYWPKLAMKWQVMANFITKVP